MRRIVSYGPAFVILLAAAAMLTAAPALVWKITAAQTGARIVLARQALDDDDILERLNRAMRNVADTVRPSVVHIEVRGSRGGRGPRSAGSGWVYDAAGHIVTNAHVLFGARSISVQFSDGRVAQGDLVGDPDPYTDIAVIKVPSTDGLFPAARATGVQPRQGERVFVFGSPFGFKFSMSQGIISGLGRDPQTAVDFGGFTNFIQTDAAVNPGNSGGPLVDIKGRVIGMNVAIATGRDNQGTTEGQSAGISFAIPLATIESVADQIIKNGSVSRGFLGIRWDIGGGFGYDEVIRSTGIRVGQVEPDGPAAKAGLRGGDFITEVDGQPVSGSEVLRSVVTSTRPGNAVKVKAWRSGKPGEYEVVLGEYPRETLNIDGARLALGRYGLMISADRQNVVVYWVGDDSPAAEAGFERGQVIRRIGAKDVKTDREAYLAFAEQGLLVGRRVPVLVSITAEGSSSTEKTIEAQLNR
jgi:serine protease Do